MKLLFADILDCRPGESNANQSLFATGNNTKHIFKVLTNLKVSRSFEGKVRKVGAANTIDFPGASLVMMARVTDDVESASMLRESVGIDIVRQWLGVSS